MYRRGFLYSLVCTVATGCLHSGDVDAEEFRRYISVDEVEDFPEDASLDVELTVERKLVTVDEKPVLRLRVTNLGEEEREVRTPFYKGAPENRLTRRFGRGVLLYSKAAPDRGEPLECIAEEDPSARVEDVVWTDEDPVSWMLGPMETGEDELFVVDDPGVRGCYPTGRYRFESYYYSWGFSLLVED